MRESGVRGLTKVSQIKSELATELRIVMKRLWKLTSMEQPEVRQQPDSLNKPATTG